MHVVLDQCAKPFSVEDEKVLWERKGMVKGLLALGGVRLRKLSAEWRR